jgi:thymidylate synthase (FAD)
MKIVRGNPRFEILTPARELREQLLRIERAGRTCYKSAQKPFTLASAGAFIRRILSSGHESVIEHSSMTVRFLNTSRGFTHELVRHRIAAFSQESTRYVDYIKGEENPDLARFHCAFIVPPHCKPYEKVLLDDGRKMSAAQMLAQEEMFYRALRKAGWVPEDARQLLPNALQSEIVITANFREWRHIFTLRCGRPAHWEIRMHMGALLERVRGIVPTIFDDLQKAGVDKHGLAVYAKDKEYFRK